jgi:hypothetical protein
MQRVRLETHVEVAIYDPLPTTARSRADGQSDHSIIDRVVQEYGRALIGITIHEVAVIQVNGIVYSSEPLNRRRVRFRSESVTQNGISA